jgi:chitinase
MFKRSSYPRTAGRNSRAAIAWYASLCDPFAIPAGRSQREYGRKATRAGVRGVALALSSAVLLGGCGGSSHTAASPSTAFSPYIDATLAPGGSLAPVARRAGVGAVTAGFLDAGRGCVAAWGGAGIDQQAVERGVVGLNAAVRVTISFGGRDGTDLAFACATAAALHAQYAAVVGRYGISALDFDIEGAALTDGRSVARRWAALAGLPGVTITATLPVEPTGLTPPGIAVLRAAIAAHVPLASVNVLAMDFGDANAPHPSGHMGGYAMQATTRTAAQLLSLYPSASSRPKLGLTVMIGRNDIADEVFTLTDARAVVSFARRERLGSLSMWSLGRDRQCPAGTPPTAQPTCSGVAQQPYAFARILRGFG